MTQRIFDVDNPQDVKELFDIIPDRYIRITRKEPGYLRVWSTECGTDFTAPIAINWRDKAEITRPVDETQWIGKLCWFQEEKGTMPFIGVLESITGDKYKCEAHLTPCEVCRPVRRDEIKFV